MSFRLLSVVMPCYDEQGTLPEIVDRVLGAETVGLEIELIIVDDGSRDGSLEAAEKIAEADSRVRVARHEANRGKGAALRTGFALAAGDIVLVQDADLEYSPADYTKLLRPIVDGYADVVFGSRFAGGEAHRVLYFWHSLGNTLLTLLSNAFANLNLTDMECGYKAFRSEVLGRISLEQDRFGFEPEVTAKVARLRPPLRIYEVGIGYRGRTYQEGKKIGWRDGIRALYCIVRYNLFG